MVDTGCIERTESLKGSTQLKTFGAKPIGGRPAIKSDKLLNLNKNLGILGSMGHIILNVVLDR